MALIFDLLFRLAPQLDVVEVNFASLETAVADARDYQALSDAHWRYQHTLFEQCFMPLKPVCEILSGILKSTRVSRLAWIAVNMQPGLMLLCMTCQQYWN